MVAVISKFPWMRYLWIVLGCLIASISINSLLVPAYFFSGGVTGLAMIFYYLADLPMGMMSILLNLPLLVLSYRLMGKHYTMDVIIGIVIFAFCLDATKFMSSYVLVSDNMLSAIFGGVFNGIGFGIVFRMNGSTGGFDIIGAIVRKYYSFNIGGVIFASNCLLMIVAGCLFGLAPAMFTLICMYMNSYITDKVVGGFNSRKAVLIVSEQSEGIAEGILSEIGRGVTFLHGQGAFTKRERNVVFVVVSLTQVAKIKLIAHAIDDHAFMIIMSANEVMGKGFSQPGIEIDDMMKARKKYEHFHHEEEDFIQADTQH